MNYLDHDELIEEQMLKSAIDLLVAQDEQYASALLLNCRFTTEPTGNTWMNGNRQISGLDVILSGPPGLYMILKSIKGFDGGSRDGSRVASVIRTAFEASLESTVDDFYLASIRVRMDSSAPFDGWRQDYLEEIRGDSSPSNQAVVASHRPAFTWQGLHFRSKTEIVLAQAFARSGVLFFPLPAAVASHRKLEPDFLVCTQQGKWGILEVHGDDFHPPETAAKEHERGRWFKSLGVGFYEVFGATECYNDPDGVVERFLRLLAAS